MPAGLGGGTARPIPIAPRPDARPIVAVEPRSRTVGSGREKVDLKKLTPEERAQRRRTRNLVMAVTFIVILLIVFGVLLAVE